MSLGKVLIRIRGVTHFHIPSNPRLWFSTQFISFRFPTIPCMHFYFSPYVPQSQPVLSTHVTKRMVKVRECVFVLFFLWILCSASCEYSLHTSAVCQWEGLCLIKSYIRVNYRVMTRVRGDVLTVVLLNSHLQWHMTFSRLVYRPKIAHYLAKDDSKLFRNTGNCIPN
jgi:hypothetical protein